MNIYVSNAVKKYGEKTVLEIDGLSLEKGKIYALMGLNGSGKTTLLQCASGLEALTSGKICYENYEDMEAVRKEISVMTQRPYLFSGSVLENIKLGMKFRGLSLKHMEEKLEKYLPCFDIEHILYKSARKLSGGEQAKAALLRTAVLETEVTFLDEPTASMDIESTLRAEALIKTMASEKRTVIVVTHDLYQAGRIADQIIFLDKGEIIEKGQSFKVLNNPDHVLVRRILRRGDKDDKNSYINYQR
jgi:tungstate transport system ATP-binding protein